MTNEFLAFAPISAAVIAASAGAAHQVPTAREPFVSLDPAQALLDEMMARVGVDGLAAALGDVRLLAQVDQHAAAVRESLHQAGRAVDAEGLAAYARSVAAAAQRMGRPIPEPGHAYLSGKDWLGAEWHLLRLVAVCMLAERDGLL
ncbi:MAG TPA: DUF6401 family natural product biosynthesis protein [Actinoplanes sp.]|nr:DUF6401 family natural product biosynthesis protein [Actinoplanes sp.]